MLLTTTVLLTSFLILYHLSNKYIYPFLIPYISSISTLDKNEVISFLKNLNIIDCDFIYEVGILQEQQFQKPFLNNNSGIDKLYEYSDREFDPYFENEDDSRYELLLNDFNMMKLVKFKLKNLNLKNFIKLIFNITISLSFLMIELVLLEIVKAGESNTKKIFIKFNLILLILILSYTIPILLILNWLNVNQIFSSSKLKLKLIIISLIFICWFSLLQFLGKMIHLENYNTNNSKKLNQQTDGENGENFDTIINILKTNEDFLTSSLQELSLFGISCLGLLSGIGSVTSIYNTFIKKNTHIVKETDLIQNLNTLRTTNNLLHLRVNEYNKLYSQSINEKFENSNNSNDNNSKDLKNEIKALKQLELSIYNDLINLINEFQNTNTIENENNKLNLVNFNRNTVSKETTIGYNPIVSIESPESLESNIPTPLSPSTLPSNSVHPSLLRKPSISMATPISKSQYESKAKFNKDYNKFLNLFSITLAIYCLYKFISIVLIKLPIILYKENFIDINDPSKEDVKIDALAVTISHLLKITLFRSYNYDEEALSVHISLLLSFGLFLGSLSNVLYTFKSVMKVIPFNSIVHNSKIMKRHRNDVTDGFDNTKNGNGNLDSSSFPNMYNRSYNYSSSVNIILISAELAGIYTISTILLLHSTIPDNLNEDLVQSFGSPLDHDFVHIWFDKLFSIGCILCIFAIFISYKFDNYVLLNNSAYGMYYANNGSNSGVSNINGLGIYDEEMMIGKNA
ncbi:hypothetical protein BVG19_g4803 [[Candida] boidinii]|nr:hypothetical protein BVG19_g4803 [[Candida] boidinii]OWB51956.1 hypothetical protein B5S27_g3527 [[Candida] boidinii]